jgi:serine/threonine protein kinase
MALYVLNKCRFHVFKYSLFRAPEVANDRPYNTSCDTYSFAIVFWEMLALKQPYFEHTLRMMHTKVWSTPHRRPDVDAQWPVPIKLLLKRAWSPDIKERNTMQQISAILKKEAIAARNGDESGLEHQKRRSTFVFRGKPTRL